MKAQILDVKALKQFRDDKHHQDVIWSDDHSRISLICMKPGQEIVTHTHHGNHIWMVMEGTGQFLTGGKSETISAGQIVIVPTFESHGIRNDSKENLVIASFAAKGD